MSDTASSGRARQATTIVAVALTLLSCYLHLQNFTNAGSLWRDEINTVELASQPSISNIYANLQYDSFPLIWFFLLRTFMRVAGWEDYALRAFGLSIGLLTLGAVWINGRLFPHRVPVLALFLIGVNGALIRYGDSLRAYGLGLLTGTLMFGALWNLTRRMNAASVTLALLSALFAVHSLFYNAVFLFAVCMGGTAVMLRRKSAGGVTVFLGIGLICALSLAIYFPSFRAAGEWNAQVRYDLATSWYWFKWGNALEMTGLWMRDMWSATFLLGCLMALVVLQKKYPDQSKKEIGIFCLTTLLVGTIGYVVFLEALSYSTEPWYYLTLMALLACCLDPLFGLPGKIGPRLALTAALTIAAILAIEPVLFAVRRPHTNIDRLATKISTEASPNDLVFIFPWQNGVSFQRYYRGPARWQTVPPLAFHRWHRYDLFAAVLSEKDALEAFLSEVETRLNAGGRVWIVTDRGFLENPDPKLFPNNKPRLPRGDQLWRMRLSILLSNHRRRMELFRTSVAGGTYEDLILEVGAPRVTTSPDGPASEIPPTLSGRHSFDGLTR